MGAPTLRTGIAVVTATVAFASAFATACESFTNAADEPTEAGADGSVADGTASPDSAVTDSGAPPCAIGTCRIVFVTSKAYKGDFGGIEQGNTECAKLADASAHPALQGRTFIAWLSAPDAGAIDRHEAENKPYVRVDGVTVASGWNQLTTVFQEAGALSAPIQIDEKGDTAGIDLVWTGTSFNGKPSSNTCTGWSLAVGAGQVGRADRIDEAWTDTDTPLGLSGDCASIARLYCFEK